MPNVMKVSIPPLEIGAVMKADEFLRRWNALPELASPEHAEFVAELNRRKTS